MKESYKDLIGNTNRYGLVGTVLAEESINLNYLQNLGKGIKKELTPTKSSSVCAHSFPNHAPRSTITIPSFIEKKTATQKSLSTLCACKSKKPSSNASSLNSH